VSSGPKLSTQTFMPERAHLCFGNRAQLSTCICCSGCVSTRRNMHSLWGMRINIFTSSAVACRVVVTWCVCYGEQAMHVHLDRVA
jgi:hypothetical protein